MLKNYPNHKELTYQLEYDGGSSQTTETWDYEINSTSSKVTGPGGGEVSESFNSLEQSGPGAGLVNLTQRADGTVIERNWQYNTPYGANAANPYVKTEYISLKDSGEISRERHH